MTLFRKFRRDDEGAITVDWVVLTASMVALGIAVMATVGGSITDLTDRVDTELSAMTIN